MHLTDQYFFYLLPVDGALRFEFDMVETSWVARMLQGCHFRLPRDQSWQQFVQTITPSNLPAPLTIQRYDFRSFYVWIWLPWRFRSQYIMIHSREMSMCHKMRESLGIRQTTFPREEHQASVWHRYVSLFRRFRITLADVFQGISAHR